MMTSVVVGALLIMIKFTVEGKPQPKQRPRMGKNGVYTPKETKAYQSLVGWIARSVFKGEPSEKPFKVMLDIYFKLPQRTKHLEGSYCMKNIDIDNVAKSVLDGINGIVWADDKQVVVLTIKKYWSKQERIEAELIEI